MGVNNDASKKFRFAIDRGMLPLTKSKHILRCFKITTSFNNFKLDAL